MALPRSLPNVARTVVVLTDGYVSVEAALFQLVRDNLGNSNFFAFSIGPEPNRYLTEGIATVGRGLEFWVPNATYVEGYAKQFLEFALTPLLTKIQLSISPNFHATELLPVPSMLLAERPLIICGKYTKPLPLSGALFNVTGVTATGAAWSSSVNAPGV